MAVLSPRPNIALPAAGVAAGEAGRVMVTGGGGAAGYKALVNTLGLRSAKRNLAGRYVTIAAGQQRLRARVANQLFAEFGAFLDTLGGFKLLGAEGRWVNIRLAQAKGEYQVGTWVSKWASARSFKLQRPAAVTDAVKSELTAAGIDSRQVVCLLAYSPGILLFLRKIREETDHPLIAAMTRPSLSAEEDRAKGRSSW